MFARSLVLIATLLALLVSNPLAAAERILSYSSDIAIARNGTMTVRETIRVNAEGNRIRRGIYREFPTRYRDRFGNDFKVDFDVLEVRRDGKPEPWHTDKRGNSVRICFNRLCNFILHRLGGRPLQLQSGPAALFQSPVNPLIEQDSG